MAVGPADLPGAAAAAGPADDLRRADRAAVGAAEHRHGSRLGAHGLAKFVRLALANNPNMLDILWADETDVLFVDGYGEALRAARNLFLSRKVAQTYAGYADDQLKRMETHYRLSLIHI